MERIEKNNNVTEFYINEELLLTIKVLGDNMYEVENKFTKIVGYAETLDEHRTEYRIDEHYSKGKNDRWYKTKKLLEHNSKWFTYILAEKGFINKTVAIK